MPKSKVEVDIENEKEWRRVIYNDVKDIKNEVTNLRVKVAAIGSVFGFIGASIIEGIKHLLTR